MSYPGPGGHPAGGAAQYNQQQPPPGYPQYQQMPQQQYAPQQYPPQPGYPGYPNVGQPANNGPWTLPSLAVIPAVLGTLVALVGVLVLPWANDLTTLGIGQIYRAALDQDVISKGFGTSLVLFYLEYGALILVLLHAVYMIAWTAGGVRGPGTAALLFSVPAQSLGKGKIAPWRIFMAVTSVLATMVHPLVVGSLKDWDPTSFQLGFWLTMLGSLIMTVAAAFGPRLPKPAQNYR